MAGQESAYTSRLLRELRALPYSYFNKIHGGAYQSAIADIVGCVEGHYVALEIKTAHRKTAPLGGLTPRQQQFLQAIRAAGGIAGVAYTDTSPDVVRTYLISSIRDQSLFRFEVGRSDLSIPLQEQPRARPGVSNGSGP